MKHAVLLVAITVLGCSSSTGRVAQVSMLHTPSKDGAVVAYDGRGRGAYVQVDRPFKVCAEPPPDVSANLSAESQSSTKASIDSLINAIAVKAALDTNQQEKAGSTIVDVAHRTEVLMVLREALYRLCELNLNGVLKEDETKRAFDYVLRTTRQLGQRDNVARLIEVLGKEGQSPEMKQDVLRVILAMSYAEQVSGMTGIGGTEQLAGAQLLKKTYDELYSNKSGTAVPGGDMNKDPGTPKKQPDGPAGKPKVQ